MSSNYPDGFVNGVTIRGVPLLQTHPGEVFWVNNSTVLAKGGIGGSDGNNGSYKQPFSTLDYAVSRCTANRGDIVFIMPGHAEVEAVAATAIVDIDVAGVAVVGLGFGDLRPSFTLEVDDGTFDISAANTILSNVRFVSSIVDVAVGFNVSAKNVVIDSVAFEYVTAGTDCFIDAVDTSAVDNACDGLVVSNCTSYNVETTNQAFIQVNGDLANLQMTGNRITMGVNDDECFVGLSTITDTCVNMLIADNVLSRLNTDGELIFEGTANDCTGFIINNYLRHADVAAALLIPIGTEVMLTNNLLSEAVDVSGFVIPAIGNDS